MFQNIQMLRAVAAVAVMVFHANAHYEALGGFFHFYTKVAEYGFLGVDIFFVISGFVVAHTTKEATCAVTNAWVFIRRRLLRVFLGYWPFFFLTVFLTYTYLPQAWSEMKVLRSFFLTTIEPHGMVLYVTWSLSFELLFYLIFAAKLVLPARWQSPTLAIVFLIVLLSLCVTLGQTHSSFMMFVSFLFEFLAGVLLGVYQARLQNWWWTGAMLVLTLAGFALGVRLHATNDSVRIFTFGLGAFALVALVVALERASIFVAQRYWVRLGDASYTLYLFHPSLLMVFYFWGFRDYLLHQPPVVREAGFFSYLVLGVWASRWLYLWMERPLYRWVVQLAEKHR